MAGHSKWANIKHRKARQDAKKGKVWGKLSRAIIVAAKEGGGDEATNLALRYAVDEAKAANMPKDTIAKAVKKGTGELGSESYEKAVYEGYGPNGVAVMVHTLTDNRNRTAPAVRHIFEKHGGKLGTDGSVSYLFSPKGLVGVDKELAGEEQVMEKTLEAGAEDVTDEGDYYLVTTDPGAYQPVREAVEAAGWGPRFAELTQVPYMNVRCEDGDARRILALIDDLEDHDDVQKVYANFDIPDEQWAAMEQP